MAGSLNKVTLIGNLGKDPEIRFTQTGNKLASFSLATTERWKDKQTNEYVSKTEWHRVTVFNQNLADVCEKYIKKGQQVYLEGTLQTRKYTDNNNIERYVTEVVIPQFRGEIVMLSSRQEAGQSSDYASDPFKESAPSGSSSQSSGSSSSSGSSASNKYDDLDDEIPF